MLRRKKVKKIQLKCIGVNRGLLTFCTDSTYFIPASVSVVAVNCDPLGSLAPPLFSINELLCICYFRTQFPRVAEHPL
jgi:hypothetical protein